MATDRTTLKAEIADWANRTDLTTANTDLFIALAEAKMFDDLLPRSFESEESLTLTQGQNYVALPTGYISPIALWLVVDSERVLLEPALPQELPYHTDATEPRWWAIDGANIRFDCPAGEAYTAYLRMMKSSALSASNTTNYLLTKRPDIYLAGCMIQYAIWARDDNEVGKWSALYKDRVDSFKASENRARGMVPLRTDLPVHSRSNIFRGD
jgi:hypothetical protein